MGRDPHALFPRKLRPQLSLFSLLCPRLCLSPSLAPMFLLGGAEEEGDVEVTHCNIIAMAIRSEPRRETGEQKKEWVFPQVELR